MLPQWTHHLKDPEEKKRFRSYIYNSKGVVDRLLEIVSQREEEINAKEMDEESYDSPSWAALQADRNGRRRELRWMKQLITLDHKDKE